MLMKVLKRTIERGCEATELLTKIDVFYAIGRITNAEYAELCGLLTEGT